MINKPVNKRVAYIGCIGVVGVISLEFGIIGVLPQIADYYKTTVENAGMLLSAFALTIALTGPFTVLYLSRFDKRKMMLLAMGLFLVSTVLSYLSPPFWILVLIRILPAFLHPVFFAMAIEAASEGISKDLQLRYTSIILGGIAIAQVSVLPLMTYIASLFDWRAIYIVQGFIILTSLLSIYFLLPPMKGGASKSYGTQVLILKKPAFIAGTLFNFLLVTSWFTTYAYFADYLTKVKNVNEQEISYLLLLFGVTGLVSNFAAGRLMGKNNIATTLFFVSGIFLLPFLLKYTDESLVSIALVVAIWGLMFGPSFFIGVIYGISAAPEARAFANSLQSSFGNLGVSVGTSLSGWFIVSQSVAVTPWIGFGTGWIAVMVLLWRFYLDRKNGTTADALETPRIH